jgi:hypothetical protein
MTTTRAFLASTGGFRFTNSWPSEPAVTLHTPFGEINVGNASSGLCGGMVFAALDYWYARRVPPVDQPSPSEPLYGYIVRRIVDSWNIPVGVAQYFTWMNLPDADTGFDVLGRHVTVDRGVSGRTVLQQWPQVQHDLDQGMPCPLGIVTTRSDQLADLGLNHQVLAYGYTDNAGSVTLRVYDPNRGRDDDVSIRFDTGLTDGTATFTHNLAIDHGFRGFFRSSYAPQPPPTD